MIGVLQICPLHHCLTVHLTLAAFSTAGTMAGCVLPLSTVRATMARREIEVLNRSHVSRLITVHHREPAGAGMWSIDAAGMHARVERKQFHFNSRHCMVTILHCCKVALQGCSLSLAEGMKGGHNLACSSTTGWKRPPWRRPAVSRTATSCCVDVTGRRSRFDITIRIGLERFIGFYTTQILAFHRRLLQYRSSSL